MRLKIVPLLLLVTGLVLAALSIPYIAENTFLGLVGVASGLLISIGAAIPLFGVARGAKRRT